MPEGQKPLILPIARAVLKLFDLKLKHPKRLINWKNDVSKMHVSDADS